jgi:hypothetical protein
MARRNRTRSRSRREALATRRATSPRPVEHDAAPRTTGYRARGSVARLGYSRAAGAPSAALERDSLMERAYVVKDFRRLGVTIAIVLALLIAAGFLESAIPTR